MAFIILIERLKKYNKQFNILYKIQNTTAICNILILISINDGESSRSAVANGLDCDIVGSEFELQSRYYVHFRTNTLEKDMNPHYPSYKINSTIIILEGYFSIK